jgi:hypothetical protein
MELEIGVPHFVQTARGGEAKAIGPPTKLSSLTTLYAGGSSGGEITAE